MESDLVKLCKDIAGCRRKLLCVGYVHKTAVIIPLHNCYVCERNCECGHAECLRTHPDLPTLRSLNPVNDGYWRPGTMSKTETSTEAKTEMSNSFYTVGRFFSLFWGQFPFEYCS